MPHLRELVELHKNDPFALIGVNTNDSPADYRKGLRDNGVTWLSAYQGTLTPIANLYRVTGYPTYILIDGDGKMVGRGHGGKEFDGQIKQLIAELKGR